MTLQANAMGTPTRRLDGAPKVTGTAPYAYEQPVKNPVYVHAVQSGVARGTIRSIETVAAEAVDGVVAVLTHRNATRLADVGDDELAVLQSDSVAFRGQLIAAVLAETPEAARHAARLIQVTYDDEPADTELRADREDLHAPEGEDPPDDRSRDEFAAAFSSADVRVDQTYTTPMLHNNPMEPHTTVAVWDEESEVRLTMFDSTQGVHVVRSTLAPLFGLRPEQMRVVAPHVGGGFGSKGMPHAHNVLAGLAARAVPGRPVKYAVPRQQMYALTGHRSPTIQRIRLGAERDGRLAAISHDSVEHSSTVKEFAEECGKPTRSLYAGAHRLITQRLATLDVPVPSWMRAPGECPGAFALEVAMDELAEACGVDPIDLRIVNDPELDPKTGHPWSSRRLVECLQEGAERFGWAARDPEPGRRQTGGTLVGMGVAASTYPCFRSPGSVARIEVTDDGRYSVRIGAVDIGTGAWTALTQIAADALGCDMELVKLEIGDTDLPHATVAGGSSGLTSWGSAIVEAARILRHEHGASPRVGTTVEAETPDKPRGVAVHSFGAQFAEVHVDPDTGEIRVPRMLGVFAVGRVINAATARSQLIGGMTMGLSMALHEVGVMDHRTGHVVNHDLAEYHIVTNADVGDVEATWLDDVDPQANPMGSKGIGEIGIVGAPAAVANAVYNATGVRVRDLPITADLLLR
ncbi:xanthine dehydrogenase family protein molybdopterin-binding subunit [Phytoactinopolyspora alkaliphila]|uniref:Xanthine dehydrogenase family protein molybdopterin-binding subunit n=1 Tax=Phytoactinopolyspora alkaliphila TaxID=1783498 RepID=A0A6N9YNQ0_9ACTN|nr:xanthine dehydrogenase family protein molybdopterin-binding subunit [Phytoactinopolyspora alkaliphila]NED96691.1 xanthine dehydrogenase family protein molybdopterin-binding subunit [Phytoactinopolyspora alkaliphila]